MFTKSDSRTHTADTTPQVIIFLALLPPKRHFFFHFPTLCSTEHRLLSFSIVHMPLQQNFNLLPLRPQVSSSLNRSHIYLFSLSGLNGYFNPMKVNFCFFPPSPFFLPLEKVVSKVVWVQLRGRAKGSAVCRKRYILGLLLHFFISSFVKIYFCVHCTLFNILVHLDRYIFNRYGNSWGIKVYNQESGDNYSKKTKQNKNLDSEAKETPD